MSGDWIGAGRCSQQKFNSAGLLRVTAASPDEVGRITSICIQRKTTPGRAIDVEVALGVTALALCSQLEVNLEEVACAQGPLIRWALTYLASDLRNWKPVGDEAELAPFRNLFSETEGAGVRRRGIQELLGIQESRMHRYLVRRPGEAWSVSDNIGEKVGSGKEPFVMIFDAVGLADTLSAAAAGPFFTWEP